MATDQGVGGSNPLAHGIGKCLKFLVLKDFGRFSFLVYEFVFFASSHAFFALSLETLGIAGLGIIVKTNRLVRFFREILSRFFESLDTRGFQRLEIVRLPNQFCKFLLILFKH